MNCYTIHDTAAEYYFAPFFARTDAEAKRMFILAMGDNFPHRNDYTLYHIGSFDQDTGNLTECEPNSVLAGRSISESQNPNPNSQQQELPLTQEVTTQ